MASPSRRSTRFQRLVTKYPTLRHIVVLVSGTAIGQIVALAASLVTARLFTPDVFGQFAIYGSLTAILITIASLRLDMTIMLPESDDEARRIARIATVSNLVVAGTATLLAIVLHGLVVSLYGSEALATWLPLAGLTIFFMAQVNVLQYWFNRRTDYRTISMNRVQQVIGSSGGQVLFGVIGVTSLAGLIVGTLLGQAFAFVNLRRRSGDLSAPVAEDTPSGRDLVKRYRKMPLLNLPTTLVDGLRLNGIPLLIGLVALGAVGQFNMAWRILQAPIGLINSAISQVFYQKLARVERGAMLTLVRATMIRSLLIAIVPFAAIYITAPWLFILLLGPQWDMAGGIARALTPWLAMQLVTSPISTVFVVTERQGRMLVFSVLFAAVPLALLYASPWELMTTLTVIGAAMALMLAIMMVMALQAARSFDEGLPEEAESSSGAV
jgi:O-antigen/teichoic acid export membrane protein